MELMRRVRARRGWLLLLVLAGAGAVAAGKAWLFSEASCPRLQDMLLYASAGAGTIVVLLYAILTRNNSPIVQLGSVFGLFGGVLAVASITGSFLSAMPGVQSVYCAPDACEEAALACSMRDDGSLVGAEQLARRCLARTGDPACAESCALELALTLYERADPSALPERWDEGRQASCGEMTGQLEEARALANQYGHTELARTIGERLQRAQVSCATPTPVLPTETPAPSIEVEVLRAQRGGTVDLIDVRVLEGGHSRAGLLPEDFVLTVDGWPIPFEFEARDADDPVCVIAVVDNSGSVYPGLEQIRAAIRALNDARKPGDELGLVVFAAPEQVGVRQYPSTGPLDPAGIDATGSLTALWDGILEGLTAARSCSASGRYLIVLTDGADNSSQRLEGDSPTRARLIADLAAEQGVSICTVGVQSDHLEPEPLRLVAQGCGYSTAEDFDEVASLFTELFGHVRDFYRLSLAPGAAPSDAEVVLRVLESVEVAVDFVEPGP